MSKIQAPYIIQITDTAKTVEKRLLVAIASELNKVLPSIVAPVKSDFQQNIQRVFTNSPEYKALVGGPLNEHFGFPRGSEFSKLDAIIDTLAREVEVEFNSITVSGSSLKGGITIKAFLSSFENILDLSEANVRIKDGSLPWLEWLLIRGDEIIVADYNITFDDFKGQLSRSGGAIMVPDDNEGWRVPAEYSGTARDNWVTRSVHNSLKFIEQLTTSSVKRHLTKVF